MYYDILLYYTMTRQPGEVPVAGVPSPRLANVHLKMQAMPMQAGPDGRPEILFCSCFFFFFLLLYQF